MSSAHTEALPDYSNVNKKTNVFDSVIVFGQGPIRPVLLETEANQEQLDSWKSFQQDPFTVKEPNFWLIQHSKYTQQLVKIQEEKRITDTEKAKLIELKRQEWQKTGWFALKAMGRQNALAAGHALYKGITKQVIFTGGRTMAPWVRENLNRERLEAWPSEAALMKQIVITHYGDMFEKKYGTLIDDVVKVEEAARNTLENFSFVINKYPFLIEKDIRVGYLSAKHHLRRIQLLAKVFSLDCEEDNQLLAAHELLDGNKAVIDHKSIDHVDEDNNFDVKAQCVKEELWSRGLKEPEFVSYWLGYLGDIKYPSIIQNTLKTLR